MDGDITRYAYDAAGWRIETASGTLTTSYRYDSVGNLLTQATSGASEIAFSYSYNNQRKNLGGNATNIRFNLETAGNLIDGVERLFFSPSRSS